jgi:hypothetical protein
MLVAFGILVVGILLVLTLTLPRWASIPVVGAPSAGPATTPEAQAGERERRDLDGVSFSVEVPDNWEIPGSWLGPGRVMLNYISASNAGGQAAEAQIFWTGYPPLGAHAFPCSYLRELDPPATVGALADAVAAVPGTELLSRTDVVVGGHAATKVVFLVRDDVGCDPGFFFSYENTTGGALWPETTPGSTVRVWVVEAGRRVLFIEGKTNDRGESFFEPQIQAIVDSIEFK